MFARDDNVTYSQLLTTALSQVPVAPVPDPVNDFNLDINERMDLQMWDSQQNSPSRELAASFSASDEMWPLFANPTQGQLVSSAPNVPPAATPAAPTLKRKSESDATAASKSANKSVVLTRRKACEPCRSKKLRCDGLRPSCSTCQRAVAGPKSCVYYADNPHAAVAAKIIPNKEVEKEKKRKIGDVRALEDRVKALEAMLASAMAAAAGTSVDITSTSDAASPLSENTSLDRSPTVSASPPSESALTTGPPGSFRHVAAAVRSSLFEDVLNKVNKGITKEKEKAKRSGQTPAEVDALVDDTLSDVGQLIVRFDLIELYFSRPSANFPFHFLHRQLFMQRIKDESPMLLFALYAAVARSSPDERVRNTVPFFFARARNLVSVHVECPTVSGLQGILLLCSASISQGLMSTAWMYLGMACRMAQFLRLDIDPAELGIKNWAEAESRRRTWWGLVILDSMSSSVINRSSIFRGDGGSVQLPVADAVFDQADVNGNVPTSMQGIQYEDYTAMFVKITKTYAEVVEYNRHTLQHGRKFSAVDPQLTLLSAQLQAWYDSFPAVVHQVPKSTQFSSSASSTNPPPYHAVALYMLHKCCLCLLWRPRMVSALSDGAQHPAATQAIEAAQAAAGELSEAVETLLAAEVQEPHTTPVDYIPFPVTLGFIEAALIHIMTYTMAHVQQAPEKLEKPKRALLPLSRFLKLMGRRVPPTQLMYQVLAGFERNLMDGEEHSTQEWIVWFKAAFRSVEGATTGADVTERDMKILLAPEMKCMESVGKDSNSDTQLH
ncbi:hypothetical protein HDU85_005538 [Gaertneriomyces sp. JEL0708]|nr:hypothetical protein HDU85_005538 [Gaertneriomyces sp. JEL0708]